MTARWKGLEAVYESPVATALVSAMEPVGQVSSACPGRCSRCRSRWTTTPARSSRSRPGTGRSRSTPWASREQRLRAPMEGASATPRAAAVAPAFDLDAGPRLRRRARAVCRGARRDRGSGRADHRQPSRAVVWVLSSRVGTTSTGGIPRHLFTSSSLEAMSPAEVNAWWTSLSTAAQATYLRPRPGDRVGSTVSLPPFRDTGEPFEARTGVSAPDSRA